MKVCCGADCVSFDGVSWEFTEIIRAESHGIDVWTMFEVKPWRTWEYWGLLFTFLDPVTLEVPMTVPISCQIVVRSWIAVVEPSTFSWFVESPCTLLVQTTIIPPNVSHKRQSEATLETTRNAREKLKLVRLLFYYSFKEIVWKIDCHR